jgi:hypothetical protein
MVESEQTAMPHISPETFHEEPIAAIGNVIGVRRCQSPVLPLRRKEVRWRTDRCAGCEVVLKSPRVRAVRIAPDSEVCIEPDRQARALCRRLNSLQLFIALPFQIAIKVHLVLVSPEKPLNRRRVGVLIFGWPFPP